MVRTQSKRFGEEEFVKLYQLKRDAIKADGLFDAVPHIHNIAADYPVKSNSVTVKLRLINGDMTADDLIKVGCNVFTIGQYLRPSFDHMEVVEYIEPDKFEHYRKVGLDLGFDFIESSPLVRSSYHSEKHAGN